MSLLKAQPARRSAEAGATSPSSFSASATSGGKLARGDTVPFKQAFETIEKAVPGAQVAVVSTLPRGSLQIVQPARFPESMLKAYTREFHLDDRLSWQAIFQQKPVPSAELPSGKDRFIVEFLRQNGLEHAAAAPLEAPVLNGYPGAVHVYRTGEQGEFTAEELRKLGNAAEQMDSIIRKSRESRQSSGDEPALTLTPMPTGRLFIFDGEGKQQLKNTDFDVLDSHLRELMSEESRARLSKANGQFMTGDRVQLPDSRGDLWTFRFVAYSRNPGLGEGPFVIVCMQPTCAEWAAVRPQDVQADAEMARLIPSLKFMRTEFHRGPTLGEIAKQVHLSPFHFHRRFADLLGLTPKHYLLECQITQAKHELLSRRKELAQIATDCGFAHQSHFTSRFKQATGLTPTRWRRLADETKRR